MTRVFTCILAVVTVFLVIRSACATEPKVIAWTDLVPAKVVEDPFTKLTDEQLQDVSQVARVRILLAQKTLSPRAVDVREAWVTEQSLKNQGIDVTWLLQQRSRVRQLRARQAKAIEPEFDGKEVKLAGYIIPGKTQQNRMTSFLLVPSIDACSHGTPPPPNQIVFVSLREGISKVSRRTPVLVVGRMTTTSTTRTFLRGNGPIDISAAYAISADIVEVYSATR